RLRLDSLWQQTCSPPVRSG
ncbi:phage head maturation protease, partial [Escherichia coli 5412]